MSGTLKGSIEHFISNVGQDGNRDMFVAVVKFFDAHTQMTRIASQAGSGYVGAQSTALDGWSGSANYSGDNAFGVWRWDKTNGDKVYILLQWSWGPPIGTSPGNPAVAQATYGLAIQFAMDTSGGNPWNGGTANLGADSKNGTNVWVAAGGDLLVWPRANGPGGSGATIRQYLANIAMYSGSSQRISMLSDDDSLWFLNDNGPTGGYDHVTWFGPYTARTGITPTTGAYVLLERNNGESLDIPWTTAFGTTTGTSNYEGGAVVDSADGVRTVYIASIPSLNSSVMEPNPYVAEYDIHDIFLRMADSVAPQKYGLFGKIDPANLAMVTYAATHDANAALTKVVFGSTVLSHYKWLVPWDGVTTPGTGITRDGVQF